MPRLRRDDDAGAASSDDAAELFQDQSGAVQVDLPAAWTSPVISPRPVARVTNARTASNEQRFPPPS
jgi:hypothetical protein